MSNDIDQNYPQHLKCDRRIKEKYLDPLVADGSVSCFANQESGEVYLLAAAIACSLGQKSPTNNSFDLRTYAKLSQNYKILIRAMALEAHKRGTEYDYEVIFDGKKVLGAVEEYANAGLEILYKKVFDEGLDFSIEGEIMDILNKLDNKFLMKKE